MEFRNFEKFEADYKKFMENDYIDFSAVKNEIDEKACILGAANSDFDFEERNGSKVELFRFNSTVEETEDGDFIYTYTYLG